MAGHICEECFKDPAYGGCCSLKHNDSDGAVAITPAEIERICTATGLHFSDVVVTRRYSPEQMAKMAEQPPPRSWMAAGGGTFYSLKLKPSTRSEGEADCVFLDYEFGCTLGAARPVACKMYPYFPVIDEGTGETHVLLAFSEEYCLATKRCGGDTQKVVELLGQTPDDLKEAVATFINDWSANRS